MQGIGCPVHSLLSHRRVKLRQEGHPEWTMLPGRDPVTLYSGNVKLMSAV